VRHEPRHVGHDAAAHGAIGAVADAMVRFPASKDGSAQPTAPWVLVEAHDRASAERIIEADRTRSDVHAARRSYL